MKIARNGNITREMEIIAKNEQVDVEFIRKGIESGRIIIPKSNRRELDPPIGIGKGLLVKINANIGSSKTVCNIEEEIENIIAENNFSNDLPVDSDIGKNTKINDADGRYIEFVKATFPRRFSLKNLRVVLDCANGAGYKVAPLVFKELDAEIFVYCNTPDGLNINEKQDNTGNLNAKINWDISNQFALIFSYHGTWKSWSNFEWVWKNYPNNMADYSRSNQNFNFRINHTLSKSTFYNINFGYLSL